MNIIMDLITDFENEWIGFEDNIDDDVIEFYDDEDFELEQLMKLYKEKYGDQRVAR